MNTKNKQQIVYYIIAQQLRFLNGFFHHARIALLKLNLALSSKM